MLGRALFCACTPMTDVEMEYEEAGAEKDAVIQTLEVLVASMRRAADDVMIVHLKLPEGARMTFRAGQYFNVVLEDGARRAFSFATAPDDRDTIEMHVRLMPGGRFTTHVFRQMKDGDAAEIEGPFGRFYAAREREAPHLRGRRHRLRAGQEHARVRLRRRPAAAHAAVLGRAPPQGSVHGGACPSSGRASIPTSRFVPVLSEAAPEDQWGGRAGLVHEAILQDFPDLSGFDIYTCGSVKMVESARPAFIAQGLTEDACFADAFFSTQPLAPPLGA